MEATSVLRDGKWTWQPTKRWETELRRSINQEMCFSKVSLFVPRTVFQKEVLHVAVAPFKARGNLFVAQNWLVWQLPERRLKCKSGLIRRIKCVPSNLCITTHSKPFKWFFLGEEKPSLVTSVVQYITYWNIVIAVWEELTTMIPPWSMCVCAFLLPLLLCANWSFRWNKRHAGFIARF